jgi:hypothetical protein
MSASYFAKRLSGNTAREAFTTNGARAGVALAVCKRGSSTLGSAEKCGATNMTQSEWEDACDLGDSVRFVTRWNESVARAALEMVRDKAEWDAMWARPFDYPERI